jgi:hypothetical protein
VALGAAANLPDKLEAPKCLDWQSDCPKLDRYCVRTYTP